MSRAQNSNPIYFVRSSGVRKPPSARSPRTRSARSAPSCSRRSTQADVGTATLRGAWCDTQAAFIVGRLVGPSPRRSPGKTVARRPTHRTRARASRLKIQLHRHEREQPHSSERKPMPLLRRHESAVLVEIEACRIGLACVYCHALRAVQGRTAWSRRTETLRRRRASSRRRGTGDTGRKRRCSISSWPSTIRSSGIVAWPKGERCRGTSKTSSKPISSAVCLSTDFFASSAILVRRRSWLRIAAIDEVLPRQPIRQWVLSLPIALRYLLATRPEVVTQVLGIVYRAISGHLI